RTTANRLSMQAGRPARRPGRSALALVPAAPPVRVGTPLTGCLGGLAGRPLLAALGMHLRSVRAEGGGAVGQRLVLVTPVQALGRDVRMRTGLGLGFARCDRGQHRFGVQIPRTAWARHRTIRLSTRTIRPEA